MVGNIIYKSQYILRYNILTVELQSVIREMRSGSCLLFCAVGVEAAALAAHRTPYKLSLLMHWVHVNKAPLSATVFAVFDLKTRPSMSNLAPERGLASMALLACDLLVVTSGTACQHISIALRTLMF